MIGSIIRITITTVVVLVLLIAGLISWHLYTTSGTKVLLNILQYKENKLVLDNVEGTIANGIRAKSFHWEDEKLSIDVKQFSGQWDISCLLKKSFCAQKLSIDKLSIYLKEDIKAKPSNKAFKPISIKLPFNTAINQLKINQLTIRSVVLDKPIILSNIKSSIKSNQQSINFLGLKSQFKNHHLNGHGKIKLSGFYPMDLKLDAIVDDFYQKKDLNLSTEITGDLSALKIKAWLYGAVNGTAKVKLKPLNNDRDMEVLLALKDNQLLIHKNQQLNIDTANIILKGNKNQLHTKINGQLRHPINKKEHIVTIDDLEGKLTPSGFDIESMNLSLLQGTVEGETQLNWEHGFEWSSNLFFKDLNPEKIHDNYPGKLGGNILTSGKLNKDNTLAFEVSPAVLQGTLHQKPLHAHVVLAYNNKLWDFKDIRLSSESNNLDIQGKLTKQWSLNGNIALNALEQLIPEAGGEISGQFNVSGNMNSPTIKLNLKSPALQYNQYQGNLLSLDGTISQLGNSPSYLRLDADLLNTGKEHFKKARLDVKGLLSQHVLTIQSNGPYKTSLNGKINGHFSQSNLWNGVIEYANVSVDTLDLKLHETVDLELNLQKKQLRIATHCWYAKQSTLCLNNDTLFASEGTVDIELSQFPLNQLNPYLKNNADLSGIVEASIKANWNNKNPKSNMLSLLAQTKNGTLRLKSKKENKFIHFDYNKINLSIDGNKKFINIKTNIDTKDLGVLSSSLLLNANLRPLTIHDGEVTLNNLDLHQLQNLLPNTENINGVINLKGKLSGELLSPVFQGTIALDQPKLLSPNLPTQLTGGKVIVNIDNKNATLDGNVIIGGRVVKLLGNGKFINTKDYDISIQATGTKLKVSQNPLISSELSPDINIIFRNNKVLVKGDVFVDNAKIDIKEIPKDAVGISPDVIILQDKKEISAQENNIFSSEVKMTLGDNVKLSGYGLKSRLAGDFTVKKQIGRELQFFGEITIPDGVYKSYGQDLTVERGQIILVGPYKQSALSIRAYREVDEIRAGLHLVGTPENLIINLYSDPIMEQERILSYIVLGRDISTTGEDSDNNMLATAALSMGIYNGRGLAKNIAENLGVKEFNIEATGRGDDTQVMLSGRLSSKLLVRYGIGVFTSVNTLSLRYDLSKQVYIETAQGLENAVDIFYSFAF